MGACGASAPRLVNGTPDVVVSSITHDSRQVRVGTLFCCIKGEKFDGHEFAAAAVERGAAALLVQRELADYQNYRTYQKLRMLKLKFQSMQ